MPLFRYEAEDNTGKVVRGVMDARNEQQVTQNLNSMGYNTRAVYGQNGANSSATSTAVAGRTINPQSSVSLNAPISVQSVVKPYQLAVFFRQLATLVKSGRPLFQSSTDIITRDRRLRQILPFLQEQIQGGRKLSGALAAFPDIFPVHAVASVWAGELAGKLEIALDEVATDFELEASEHRYAIIGRFLGKVTALALVFAIPASNLANMFLPSLQAALDNPTMNSKEVLVHIANTYLRTTCWKSCLISVFVIAIWIIWGYMKRKPGIKRRLDSGTIRAPIWGKLHRYRSLCRFLHVLDGLLSSGIAPATAWDAASLTPRNSDVAERLRNTRASVAPDAGIPAMCAASGVFDAEDVGLAMAGEKAGSLPEALAQISNTYQDKASAQRVISRAWSVGFLVWSSILLTACIGTRMVMTYVDMAIKAAEMVGK